MNAKRECIIPKEALDDPKSRELMRAWVAKGALHVSLLIPDEWDDAGHWGVALADVTRHLADAYHKSQGLDPKLTIQRIQQALATELADPTDTVTGDFVDE